MYIYIYILSLHTYTYTYCLYIHTHISFTYMHTAFTYIYTLPLLPPVTVCVPGIVGFQKVLSGTIWTLGPGTLGSLVLSSVLSSLPAAGSLDFLVWTGQWFSSELNSIHTLKSIHYLFQLLLFWVSGVTGAPVQQSFRCKVPSGQVVRPSQGHTWTNETNDHVECRLFLCSLFFYFLPPPLTSHLCLRPLSTDECTTTPLLLQAPNMAFETHQHKGGE